MTETELIDGVKNKEESAQKELYLLYSYKMWDMCRHIVYDDDIARDLVQNGFIKIFSKIDAYSSTGSFEGWIRTIIKNEALYYLRQKKLHYMISTDDFEDLESNDYCPLLEIERDELLNCIKKLPKGYRTVLSLYSIEGYSHKEIGDILGISENTSHSQYVRAKSKLLKLIRRNEK